MDDSGLINVREGEGIRIEEGGREETLAVSNFTPTKVLICFPLEGSDSREPACCAEDPGLIPGLGRYLGEGNGNPLQYSFLENRMDRGVWQATVREVSKSQTRLSN